MTVGYLSYLYLFQGASIIVFGFIGLVTMTRIVFCNFFRPGTLAIKSLSATMLIYMITHIVNLSLSFTYHFYMVFWWRPDKNIYKSYFIFWFGIWTLNYLVCGPIVIFFLTLDRCLVLKMAFRYNDRIKAWLVRTILLALFIAYLSSTFIYLMELPLDLKKGECLIFCNFFKIKTVTFFLIATPRSF
uniref:G-protein coupled receptors family 1 profile domain-containing protein n=1 Tax=Ditylenchus dipsaci TaxID=166011 RepID=A0A915DBJ8_9BILA